MPWAKVTPVYNPKVIGLCGTPYHAHPKGCHNFCKKHSCPPTLAPMNICLDNFYLIYIKFPIGKHVRAKLEAHPEWTIYQARNVLYWQPRARKIANAELKSFLGTHSGFTAGPRHLDSWGIDMTATAAQAGIKLKWGDDWGTQPYTYILRCAGEPIHTASKARMRRLRQLYPAIYHKREGACKGCRYRPCLTLITNNAPLYVGRKLGPVKIESYLPDRGWLLRCDCGHKRLAPLDRPLCQSLCKCAKKEPSASL